MIFIVTYLLYYHYLNRLINLSIIIKRRAKFKLNECKTGGVNML